MKFKSLQVVFLCNILILNSFSSFFKKTLGHYCYQILKKDGDTTIMEAKPKSEAHTIYGKRVIWIDGKLVVTRVEYYSPEGSLIKTQRNSGIVEEKGCWRVNEARMENLLLKRSTIFTTTKRQLDGDVPASVFTKTFLEEKSR